MILGRVDKDALVYWKLRDVLGVSFKTTGGRVTGGDLRKTAREVQVCVHTVILFILLLQ